MSHYQAEVEVLLGHRTISNIIIRAGLGIEGVGIANTFIIDYKPGEEVDLARVKKAMNKMVADSEDKQTDFVIHSYEVTKLTLLATSL